MSESEYISVKQFAEKYNIDTGNVRHMILKGRIPAIKIGNQWAIKSDEKRPDDARIKSGKYINVRKNKKTD